MNRILFFVIAVCCQLSFSQQITIEVKNLGSTKAALYSLEGEKLTLIDSINVDNGLIQYNMKDLHQGFYRFNIGGKWIQVLNDKEDIKIETSADHITDSMKVIQSESNKLYNSFLSLSKDYKLRSELLHLVLGRYPESGYRETTQEELIKVQEDYFQFVNDISQGNPESYIARYIRSAQLSAVEENDPLGYLKSHALDMVNFYDDELIYSDAFTSKVIEYLSYYRNPELPMNLLEQEFLPAVDTILIKARVNEIVYKHVVEYLLDGFKKFGFDNVLNYITANYVIKDDLCLDVVLEKALARRIQQIKTFKPGIKVPDVVLPDPSGSMIELGKINTEKTLILFYSSLCSHCKTMLPQLYQIYKNRQGEDFEILAVSLDTTKTEWLEFIKSNQLNWINVSDLKGWDGDAASRYFIYATPTMFLVNRDGSLVGMPQSLEEAEMMLKYKK